MPGNPDYRGGTQLATATVAINNSAQSIPAQSEVNYQGNIQGLGYEFFIQLEQTAASAVNSPTLIRLTWTDQATGLTLERQSWWVLAASFGFTHTIIGKGPSAANQLTVKVRNDAAGAPAITATVTVLDVSRPYLTHVVRTEDTNAPVYPGPNSTAADSDMNSAVLAELTNINVPINSSVFRVLPLWSGPIQIKQFGSAGNGIDVAVNVVGISSAPFQGTLNEVSTALGVTQVYQMDLPRLQCAVQLKNTSGAAATKVFGYVTALMD